MAASAAAVVPSVTPPHVAAGSTPLKQPQSESALHAFFALARAAWKRCTIASHVVVVGVAGVAVDAGVSSIGAGPVGETESGISVVAGVLRSQAVAHAARHATRESVRFTASSIAMFASDRA